MSETLSSGFPDLISGGNQGSQFSTHAFASMHAVGRSLTVNKGLGGSQHMPEPVQFPLLPPISAEAALQWSGSNGVQD